MKNNLKMFNKLSFFIYYEKWPTGSSEKVRKLLFPLTPLLLFIIGIFISKIEIHKIIIKMAQKSRLFVYNTKKLKWSCFNSILITFFVGSKSIDIEK